MLLTCVETIYSTIHPLCDSSCLLNCCESSKWSEHFTVHFLQTTININQKTGRYGDVWCMTHLSCFNKYNYLKIGLGFCSLHTSPNNEFGNYSQISKKFFTITNCTIKHPYCLRMTIFSLKIGLQIYSNKNCHI